MNKYGIILAAGKGTRMKSDLPKCAYPLAGKPMLCYLVETLEHIGLDEIVTVVGYKKEIVKDCLKAYDVKYVIQDEQLGTGHATNCAKPELLSKEGLTLILPGDTPLVDEEMLSNIIDCHIKNKNDLTLMTTILSDPGMFGRIYRENGRVKKIIEFKDCNEEQKKIKEINVAIYVIDNKILFDTLDKIKNNNNQKEYYLTDIVEILGSFEHYKVDTFVVKNDYRIAGINDLEALKAVEDELIKHKR